MNSYNQTERILPCVYKRLIRIFYRKMEKNVDYDRLLVDNRTESILQDNNNTSEDENNQATDNRPFTMEIFDPESMTMLRKPVKKISQSIKVKVNNEVSLNN